MAGLVPAIHVFLMGRDVDAREKPGHGGVVLRVPGWLSPHAVVALCHPSR